MYQFDSGTDLDQHGVLVGILSQSGGRLPVVAIGGVTLETAAECWRAGAASVAVISELERSSDRRALVAAYPSKPARG